MSPPTFRTTNVTPTSLRLHYIAGKKTRLGLGPVVVGIVQGIAEHHLLWPSNQLKVVQEKYVSRGADHDIFYISWRKEQNGAPSLDYKNTIGTGFRFTLTPTALNAAFPFHFCLDKKLVVLQVGSVRVFFSFENYQIICSLLPFFIFSGQSLLKLMKGNIVGEDFNSRFQIVNPVMTKISYKHIERLKEKEFTIHCEVERNTLELKGQWLPSLTTGSSSSSKVLCFVGSPMIRSAKENELLGLSFSDFAIHDPSKDRLFALEALQAANRVNDIKTSSSATSFTDEASCSEDTERDILGCPSASLFRRNSIQKTIPHPLSSKSTSILNPELMEKRCPGPGSDQLNHLYPPFAPRYFSPSADLSLKSYPSYKPLSLLSVFIYFLSFFFLLDSSV